ncbi:MAG: hypothetical protein ABI586_03480 [Candidatus Nanopelagicales bacterium]
MTSQDLASPLPMTHKASARAPGSVTHRFGDVFLYALLALLVVGTWQFSRLGYFKSGDDIGYWLGVTGATMILLLFTYPMRKYLPFTHRWGKIKWWFIVHMTFGICGPLLILVHSTFQLRSVNATVALASMLIVAGSGVIGRFLYLRIHRDLQGRRNNLVDLQRHVGLAEGDIKSRFRFAPEVAKRLLEFEAPALSGGEAWSVMLWRVFVLPIRRQWAYQACMHELTVRLRTLARENQWSGNQALRRRRQALALIREYLRSVVKVAQFSSYVRLFALWHVLHVPFVYLLVVTVCFHIFAVHAY